MTGFQNKAPLLHQIVQGTGAGDPRDIPDILQKDGKPPPYLPSEANIPTHKRKQVTDATGISINNE